MFPNSWLSQLHMVSLEDTVLGRKKMTYWADIYRNAFASAGGKGKQTFLKSKIGSCCVMDTLGSITSLYQVIQEYLIFSVGQGLPRNSISYKITWYSWKNRQALACYFSFALPRCFMRLLWLHQFVTFDPSLSVFYLMSLRYLFYLWLYYLRQHGTVACCPLYKCYVLSLNTVELIAGKLHHWIWASVFFISIFIPLLLA